LHYAHQQGVLHRDVKPANLLLDTHGTVWVTDFGLAKTTDHPNLTGTGDLLGTLRYMPPEAFDGRADRRGDVYALGLTLYELLALRPAFGEKDRNRLIKDVTTGEPARLERVNPAIPRDLVTIVHKAIERDPAHRYPSAGALAADLQRFLADEPIHARPIWAGERLGRWCRRNPLVASLTAAVAVVAVVGFAATFTQMRAALENETQARSNAAIVEKQRDEIKDQRDKVQQQRDRAEAAYDDLKKTQGILKVTYYDTHVNLMQAAWDAGNLRRVLDLLELYRPRPGEADLRGWEWHYFDRLCHADLRTLQIADRLSSQAILSGDGSRLADLFTIGEADGMPKHGVKVWDTATGKELMRADAGLHGFHLGLGKVLMLNRDGTRLAVRPQLYDVGYFRDIEPLSLDQMPPTFLRVLDVGTGKEIHSIRLAGPIPVPESTAFNLDGDRVAQAATADSDGRGKGAVHIWTTAAAKERLTIPVKEGLVHTLAFSADGKRLAGIASLITPKSEVPRGLVFVWDAATGKELLQVPVRDHVDLARVFRGPDGQRYAGPQLVFSPDGKYLARIHAWLTPSPDSENVMTAGLTLLETDTGKEVRTITTPGSVGLAVRFSPQGNRVAALSTDPETERTVWLWDATTGPEAAHGAGTPSRRRGAGVQRRWAAPGDGGGGRHAQAVGRRRPRWAGGMGRPGGTGRHRGSQRRGHARGGRARSLPVSPQRQRIRRARARPGGQRGGPLPPGRRARRACDLQSGWQARCFRQLRHERRVARAPLGVGPGHGPAAVQCRHCRQSAAAGNVLGRFLVGGLQPGQQTPGPVIAARRRQRPAICGPGSRHRDRQATMDHGRDGGGAWLGPLQPGRPLARRQRWLPRHQAAGVGCRHRQEARRAGDGGHGPARR
jgi:hypothetical protein